MRISIGNSIRKYLFGILVVSLWTCEAIALSEISEPPNIVMIISDDQAWTDYSFMGHKSIQTPNLDRLARQSIVFRRGYVPTSLCRPSLMTLITGQYAHVHGVTGNDPSPKKYRRGTEQYKESRAQLISFVDQAETLPRRLGKLGYMSFQSGKWWEGNYQRGGFTHGMTRGFPKPGGRHGDDGLKIGREGMKPINDFIDLAIQQDKPFFIWYAPFLPHTPHTPPQRLLKKYSPLVESKPVAKYQAMCEWFDETCGQLIQKLDDENLRDNTIIVYVCDNGWIQNPAKRGYAPRSKQTPYEGGVRTPIMYHWPKNWKPAERSELASSVDIVPTLLGALEQAVPASLPGINLSPRLKDQKPLQRDTIFGEGFSHDIADLEQPEATLLYRWCIVDQWKLILTYDGEVNRYQTTHPRTIRGPQLFDLLNDPFEKKNLAMAQPDLVTKLRGKIENWYPLSERKELSQIKPNQPN